ncbi:MAG TPA: TRAP transporter small permease [Tahibacter sp.]|nr:TRAP transporter small permease [Tahibacter sp.]
MTSAVRVGPLDAALVKLCRLGETVAMVLVGLVTLLVVLQVIAREVFVVGLAWADEASRWAGLGVIFLVVPLIALHGGHVRVDMFLGLLPPRARRVVQGLDEWLGVLFCALFLYAGWYFLQRAGRFTQPAMGLSNLWFYMPAAIGMVLLFLVMLRRAVAALAGKPLETVSAESGGGSAT